MSSIWYPWCRSECECCSARGCSSVGVSTCWRSVKGRFLVGSIFWSLPCQGRSEVLLERWGSRKSALAWGEDRSSCWGPKSKSESSTSLADSAVRNSSHPWSVLGFFAGEDSLVVARCCLISSSSSGAKVSVVVGDVVDVAWGGWGGKASGRSWDSWDSGCLISMVSIRNCFNKCVL